MFDVKAEVLQAEARIRPFIRETPLDFSSTLSEIGHCQVFLKLENLQYTASFKVRGATNKLLSLAPEQQTKGVVAASSGNHGAAVAFCSSNLQVPSTIFVPENAVATKVNAIRRFGADLRFYGNDAATTEIYARNYARENDLVYISPYNDPQVIGGQGTIAVELSRQLEKIDAVFVPVGGGGMISGIAGYLKLGQPDIVTIGCSPANSPVMAESVKANRIIEMESLPTLSDGTAGGIEPGAVTFDLCKRFVDDYVLVSESEIKDAMRLFMETHHMLIEGAAGVALAAYQKQKHLFWGKNVVLVICGANISLEKLKAIL
jgi:threonine dehydratase